MTPVQEILFKVLIVGGVLAFLSILYHGRRRALADTLAEAHYQSVQAMLSLIIFLVCGIGAFCLTMI